VIEARGLGYTYPGAQVPAVRGLTFRVEKGEVFGFLGPSGAGKSTTQKVLIALQRDYEGTVTILGRDLRHWDADYYEHIGVSFEFPNHYLKLTARENLELFRGFYGQATASSESVLEAVGLAEDGDQRVGAFSKGMRIRLNLARALLHRRGHPRGVEAPLRPARRTCHVRLRRTCGPAGLSTGRYCRQR
jgi:fluoroquinolone transport system ATP-binding protein